MPLTPDSQLDLLFPTELVPLNVRMALHSDLHVRPSTYTSFLHILIIIFSFLHIHSKQIRPLASTDYRRGHLDVLRVLTSAPDPGETAWVSQFHALRACANTYFLIVVVDKQTDRIVGAGGVFIERKFLRDLGLVGTLKTSLSIRRNKGRRLV